MSNYVCLSPFRRVDLSSKGFFNDLTTFFSSGPIVAMVWEGEDVIATGRRMLGATKPKDSAPGTIRGDFAVSDDLTAFARILHVFRGWLLTPLRSRFIPCSRSTWAATLSMVAMVRRVLLTRSASGLRTMKSARGHQHRHHGSTSKCNAQVHHTSQCRHSSSTHHRSDDTIMCVCRLVVSTET